MDLIGRMDVYRDPETGELVVDDDSLRRFSGDLDVEDDQFEVGYDDEFGADDEDDDDDGYEFGRRRKSKKKRKRRNTRRSTRRQKVATKTTTITESNRWGMTAVSGSDTLTAAGDATVRIRLQHDFRAQDITFEGSASGAKVKSIFFGDRPVWSSADGIPVAVFAGNSNVRGLLKGQELQAGLDIVITGSLSGSGTFSATIIGAKPI